MSSKDSSVSRPAPPLENVLPLVSAGWAILLAVAFLASRGQDVGRLPALLASFATDLARGPMATGRALADDLAALLIAALVVCAWYGVGSCLLGWLARLAGDTAAREGGSPALAVARACAVGAGTTSLIWFALGLLHAYREWVAIAVLAPGLAFFVASVLRVPPRWPGAPPRAGGTTMLAAAMIGVAVITALLSSLAPPTAKDALIYHRAVPKVFLAAGGLVDVPGNIASFFALGGEMNGLWADLLGRVIGTRAGEAAFGVVLFAWFPLLLMALYGWARSRGLTTEWAVVVPAVVAAIPTAWYVAGHAYVDLALVLYALLAVDAAGRWWRSASRIALLDLALALGCALAVKHVALMFLVPLPLLVLLVVRRHRSHTLRGAAAVVGSAALMLGGAVALGSIWYVRTWIRTGNPLFPFYVNVLGGHAAGWDQQRSALLQTVLSLYGGGGGGLVDYLVAP
ncbi:MAG: hypothetical protein HYR86_09635, partial [Candidatus Rokubacteria bacterium]|nr:hypothetical protein [Candidatus Rokubacteria bacterium]